MAQHSIWLTAELERFANEQIIEGRAQDMQDYVRMLVKNDMEEIRIEKEYSKE
jgi:Arc/MetJ-type ribon-helix-helix transcriptional regulator